MRFHLGGGDKMERYLGTLLIAVILFLTKDFRPTPSVQAESIVIQSTTESVQPVTTESRFSEKLEEQVEVIPKKTIYKDDPEVEASIETILDEGEDGKITKIIKITYYEPENTPGVGLPVPREVEGDSPGVEQNNKEYSREIISTETTPPKDKIISRGTKIVWKTLDTADGQISYWKKMRVYATHYDSRCPGCNEWTAIGMRAGYGVIAVDPSIIKLRSKVYIPGYGVAVAGDTGGAIKGNIIDLGFDDARTAGWRAQFVDIYLL